MNSTIIIPARFSSSRFPGKPAALIAGCSMLERTWQIASSVKGIDRVIIATEDERIIEHAESFGAEVILTSETCRNGTERVFETIGKLALKPDLIINFQGDALLTPPSVLQAVVDAMRSDPNVRLATPAVQLTYAQYKSLVDSKSSGDPGGTLVTFDKNFNALYFSKSLIPFLRKYDESALDVFRHIGIYGYRYDALEEYLSLEPSRFEKCEQLEQLRALENGIPIRVVLVDYAGRTHWSVDSPEDVSRAEEIIAAEGELVL